MTAQTFLDAAIAVALAILCLSLLLATIRILRGPTLPDRALALDMLVAIGIGLLAVLGIASSQAYLVDIAIALGLVGFLATIALARFVLGHGPQAMRTDDGEGGP